MYKVNVYIAKIIISLGGTTMAAYYIVEINPSSNHALIKAAHVYRVTDDHQFDATKVISFDRETIVSKIQNGFGFRVLTKSDGQWHVGNPVAIDENGYIKITPDGIKADYLGHLPTYD